MRNFPQLKSKIKDQQQFESVNHPVLTSEARDTTDTTLLYPQQSAQLIVIVCHSVVIFNLLRQLVKADMVLQV